MIGILTNEDEAGLRCLAEQIITKKLVLKLFLRYPLHAKLYLLFRQDPINPKIGYLGSSNLTLAGLSKQGELNMDVLDHDTCDKLAQWFVNLWDDQFCLDIFVKSETEFIRRYQCPVRSPSAFEKNEYADDWRDLMRFYLIQRTHSSIQAN